MDNNPVLTDDTFTSYENQPTQDGTSTSVTPTQVDQAMSDLSGALVDVIPGGNAIVKMLRSVNDLPDLIGKAIKDGEAQHPLEFIQHIMKRGLDGIKVYEGLNHGLWSMMADVTIGPLFSMMLEEGLGVSLSEFTKDELAAVNTVDTMVGFATVLPFITGGINAAGKALLANRWPETIAEALNKLPEEMGLTWSLGLTIDEAFKAAQGVVLEEAINKQKRPNRIAWQQARIMLKQHLLNDDQMIEIFQHQGYRDDDIHNLMKLADQTIPIGDIAQLWYRDIIDSPKALDLIRQLGFNEEQTQWLFNMYIAKADTQATASYRAVAKQMFTAHLITKDMYIAVLHEGNFPERMIAEDIKAIELEQSIGRVLHSVTEIKTRYQHKSIDATEATKELRELNYSEQYITELISTWSMQPLAKTHGLSQSKILSYMVSGLVSPQNALPLLLATGLDEKTASFLIAHPTANEGVRQHARSPGLVNQAYLDGAIPDSELPASFTSAGVKEADIAYYVHIAQYRLAHKRGSPTYTASLTAADIRAAFKGGIIDFQQCVTQLELLGYRPDDAMLLTEITNKGPYQPPSPPVFRTLNDAAEYLTERGYTLVPPPDPRLLAAENMLASSGYSWNVPQSTSPGSGSTGGLPPLPQ